MNFRVPIPVVLTFVLALPRANAGAISEKTDFVRDIQPIISSRCFQCHGPDEKAREAKLRLDLRDEAIKEREGVRAIVPGDPAASEMIIRITSTDKDEVMPPPKEGHPLTTREISLLKEWVQQGADYKPHWAFAPPQRPVVPALVPQATNPIDAFVRQPLIAAGLSPSPPAEADVLLRRVTLDLTGLPPTPAELAEFRKDHSEAVYEKVVDRLLASPAYGERWAKMWLDLARYADSTGYGSDMFRLNVWPYRDWVISALNRNIPYDQFTIEQIAGDLLPNATDEQIAATAFHRNTMTNVEGGTDDEEYRVAAIKDRVATTGQVWMGLTFGCAQCHSHKFDPISQKEYYQLFAVFNQTEDSDRQDEAPRLPLPTPEQRGQQEQLAVEIAALERELKSGGAEFEAEQQSWEAEMARPVDWQLLAPRTVKVDGGATLTIADDGTISATGRAAYSDAFTIATRAALRGMTAFRIEMLPDPNSRGDAVINQLRITAAADPVKPAAGRFVRFELSGENKILALAEVQVFAGGKNVARQGKATQSSTAFEGAASRAIDGETDGNYFRKNSVTHTREESAPWWELDLGAETAAESIVVWNRTDQGLANRLKDCRVSFLDAQRKVVWQGTLNEVPNPKLALALDGRKPVVLRNVSSDIEGSATEIARIIDQKGESQWKFPLPQGAPRAIVVESAEPVGDAPETELVFHIAQNHSEHRTLSRFRIFATTKPHPVRELSPAIRGILAVEPTERSDAQRKEVADYFRPLSESAKKINAEIDAKKAALAKIKPIELPVMREKPRDQRRKSFILNKGNFAARGDEVLAGLPAAFRGGAPESETDRLGLARWLVSRNNPLTARVAVNRYWAQLFGKGIVESEEDFGTQGALPTHPALLDWLAIEFMDKGWDVKALLKSIVLSGTYRQDSRTNADQLQRDPNNRLLGRYGRRRLDAETVRDQALAVSGLLSHKIGGPSVYPPQPPGLWNVAFNGGQNGYPTSTGEDRYRRGLYTFWRRTMPNPTMTTFDAPSRETCTVRRTPTNTPLQAFVTLNDPVFVECAQALARRILREGGADTASRLRFGLKLCLAREPNTSQLEALQKLLDDELHGYRADIDAAKKLAAEPLGPLPQNLDPAEAAAWTVVANVLLNLDAVLTKS